RVDLDGRKIDFRLVRDDEEAASLLRARREKAAERNEALTSAIVALKDADRTIKAAAKGKTRARSASVARSKSAVRKSASGRGGGARTSARR
ncbi:MAG: ribonuclease R, partial [Rhizobacter sp.]|nr:ribonuclease R [Rhizobacter sp.]